MSRVKRETRDFSPITLREARLNHFMTQEEVAREIGISLRTYQGWEAGAWEPGVKNVRKLADVLDVERISFYTMRDAA